MNLKKVLITVHLGRHFRKFGHYDFEVLLNLGYEVHVASNFSDELDFFEDSRVIKHQIDFDRNPFGKSNIRAYKQLKKLLSSNSFDIIHTQSPSGGVVTRLAYMRSSTKNDTKLVYTPHGYHFYKGAPFYYWLLFYPIEKFLLKGTDYLITINDEDYKITVDKMGMEKNKVFKIPGVGVDIKKFSPVSIEKKLELKEKHGLNKSDFVLISVAELINRKNQQLLIENLKKINDKNIKLLLVGTGENECMLKKKTEKLNLQDQVFFLGQRKDVGELLQLSDVFVSASKQEGLPLSVLEGMASGLPLIVSDVRGNRDLIFQNKNGVIIKRKSESFDKEILRFFYMSQSNLKKRGEYNLNIIEKYSIENVQRQMKIIYENILAK